VLSALTRVKTLRQPADRVEGTLCVLLSALRTVSGMNGFSLTVSGANTYHSAEAEYSTRTQ